MKREDLPLLARDGRLFEPRLEALVRPTGDGRVELLAPAVGLWRGPPLPGDVVVGGGPLGELEVLGVRHRVVVPATAHGAVVETRCNCARCPVGWGDLLVVIDPSVRAVIELAADLPDPVPRPTGALMVRAPSSGRVYLSPGPGKPPFVRPGDRLVGGQVICLLEVMKTFNRVRYGGDELPDPAVVKAVLRRDEEDVHAGDPLFEVVAAE